MSWDFYDSTNIKKTRKDHTCELCGLKIPKGSNCFYYTGKWEGDFASDHNHNECRELYDRVCEDKKDYDFPDLSQMHEVYPYQSFESWQKYIRNLYKLD